MRYYEKSTIVISKDATTDPKQIRFSDDNEDADAVLIVESITREENFPIGTNVINMGQVASGRWLWIKPAADCGLVLNGGAALAIRGGKATKMWVTFTSISVVVASAPQMISLVVGGQ